MTFDKSIPVFKDWTEGPFGVPMPDKLAKACEKLVKALPKEPEYEYRRLGWIAKYSNELREGERADISIIATGAIDRDREILIPKGVDLSQFRANPVVTFNHAYDRLPIGKAAWIRYDADLDAIKAKTLYEARPDGWASDWIPDAIFSMVKNGTMLGKSIGALPLKVHRPTKEEIARNPAMKNVRLIYDEVAMFEYSVVPVPANQDALVEAVSKGMVTADALKALGMELPESPPPESKPDAAPAIVLPAHVVSERDLADAVRKSIRRSIDVAAIARDAVHLCRGGV